MEIFSSADLQRASGDVQRAAALEPVIITNYDRPTFVMMTFEHYDALRGGERFIGSGESLPDSAIARLEALAAAYPDEDVELLGDLDSLLDDETGSSRGPTP